jgi:ADP-ribosylglycohydrolase
MYGAILGDIIGSYYEYNEFVSKNIDIKRRLEILDDKTPLFKDTSIITDDSILTIAIADALINNSNYGSKLKEHAKEYLNTKNTTVGYFSNPFSPGFTKWVNDNYQGVSNGNGAAMRISPIGYFYDDLDIALEETVMATVCSHNCEEAIKGAKAITASIFLLRKGYTKEQLKIYIEQTYKYNLDLSLKELQANNTFKMNCDDTVPKALFLFLISNDFEDCIRKAISIGGDTDTIACIAGSVAEAYYDIPIELKKEALKYLDDQQKNILSNYYKEIRNIKIISFKKI